MVLISVMVVALIVGGVVAIFTRRQRGPQFDPTDPRDRGFAGLGRSQQVQDAEAEARRWLQRLGAGITNTDPSGNAAALQALADASERHQAALRQLATARSATQFGLVSQTAIEGLHYIRAARTTLGLEPGPALPDIGAGQLDESRRVTVGGQDYLASPQAGDATPYYYPGGVIGGRRVPGGWYSTPWWKTALVAGAASAGGMLLMDALFDGFHQHSHHHMMDGFGGPGRLSGPGGPGGFGGRPF